MSKIGILIKFGHGIGDYTEDNNPDNIRVPRLGDFMIVCGYADEGYSVDTPMYRPDGSEIYPHNIGPESFKFVTNVEDIK